MKAFGKLSQLFAKRSKCSPPKCVEIATTDQTEAQSCIIKLALMILLASLEVVVAVVVAAALALAVVF